MQAEESRISLHHRESFKSETTRNIPINETTLNQHRQNSGYLSSISLISQNTHFRFRLANDHAVQSNRQTLLNLQILQWHLNLGDHGLHVAAGEVRIAGFVRKSSFHRNVARHRGLTGVVLSDDRVTSGILCKRLRDDQAGPPGVRLYLKRRIPTP